MKNSLRFAICLFVVLASCKKSGTDSPVSSGSITATVDGVNANFSVKARAQKAVIPGLTGVTLNITGETNATGIRSYISASVTLNQSGALIPGTYSSFSVESPTGTSYLYYAENASSTMLGQTFATNIQSDNITTLTISSVSSTNVQGTFSGKLVNTLDDTTTRTITNGKFNLPSSN